MLPFKSKPLYLQVEEFLRNQIDSGAYPVNGKLPTTEALAVMTGTSVCTVQAALSKLCREGLLDRKSGRGTYVKGDKSAITCAGLYFNKPFSQVDSAFYQVLNQELRRKLNEQGVKVRIWLDEREEEEQHEAPVTLDRAMEKREIQALIVPLTVKQELDWLQKTPVPVSILSTDQALKNRVSGDVRNMLQMGLAELRHQGCRTVGVITHLTQPLDTDFYPILVDVLAELGMETRNSWVRIPAPGQYITQFALFGHKQFHELWDLSQRPDGLFVFPDNIVTGVITAMLERRLNVPQDLRVVFHANDLMPYVCPFAATFVRSEVGAYADALIQQMRSQLEGDEAHPLLVPYTVVQNGSPFSTADTTHTFVQ